MGRDSFKKSTKNGVTTYFYNGKEVSKEEFDAQREAADQRQTEILGISKEDFKKETREQRKKRMFAELKGNAKGGIVKKYKGGLMVKPRAAKRGY